MKYFKFELFAISNTAKKKGIDNSVPPEFQPRAEELVNTILDPLREAWGSGINMTSGFRCLALNNAIGGSKTSAHSYAYAADLVPQNGKIEEFKDFTMHWLFDNHIKFDQYINEYKGSSSWVHIGIRNGSGQLRQQYKLFYGGKYTSINPLTFSGIKNREMSANLSSNAPIQSDVVNNVDSSLLASNQNTSSGTAGTYGTDYGNNFITGGGNTQTGNTNGLLTAQSVYYDSLIEDIGKKNNQDNKNSDDTSNNSIDEKEIRDNAVYAKDENGDPILDEDGNPIVSDEYLYGIDEGDDMIDDEEVPNVDEIYPLLADNQNGQSHEGDSNNSSNSLETSKTSTNIGNIPSVVDIEDKNANTPETREQLEKIRLKRNLEKWRLKSQDLSKEEAKAKLYEWLKKLNIMLLNAFYIVIIMDMINKIKSLSEQLQNTSQFNMMNLLNSLYDVIGIFEDLGVAPGAEGITMDDLKNLGMAAVGTIADTGVNIGNLVYYNYMQTANRDMLANALANVQGLTNLSSMASGSIDSTIANSAKSINAGTNINNASTFSSSNIMKATSSDIVANMVDGGISNIIHTSENMNMNTVTGAAEEIRNNFTNITTKKEPFTYTQSNKGKDITINIVLNKDPGANSIKVKSFIKSFKYGNNENIFNAGATKYIRDTFNNAWKTKEELTIYVDAVLDGITKHYIFNFTINNNQTN